MKATITMLLLAGTINLSLAAIKTPVSNDSTGHVVRFGKSNSFVVSEPAHADLKSTGAWKEAAEKPYRLSWKTDGVILGTALGTRLISGSMDDSRTPLTLEQAESFTHRNVNWFDRSATYKFNKNLRPLSDQLGSFAILAPLSLLADKGVRRDILTVSMMFLEVRELSVHLPAIAKSGITRYRPYVYNPNVSYEEKIEQDPGKSFFSNQSTAVFASAVFIAKVYSDYHPDSKAKPWIWAASLVSASAISIVRYETGIHYTSDILVGAAVGSAIGYFIPKLHAINRKGNVKLTPGYSQGAYTMAAQIKL